jgi:2-hydroxychromene-2-carboxylate isomerase
MNVALRRKIARVAISRRLREARLSLSRLGRSLTDQARVHYFHQVDDPYSHLTAQVLMALSRRYRIALTPHLVPPPSDSAAPDRPRLEAWARRDAIVLAQRYQLEPPQRPSAPGEEFDEPADPQLAKLAAQALTSAIVQQRFALIVGSVGRALWHRDAAQLADFALNTDPGAPSAALRLGSGKQKRLGHYMGASFYFGGDWYWGIDRLHYLEQRLRDEGLAIEPLQALIAPAPELLQGPAPLLSPDQPAAQLHFFGSFGSPYTYLALHGAQAIASRYGAQLQLHFVLPMVMRGLATPRAKRLYIIRDAKREADRLGIPFGKITDPTGLPTERGLAVLQQAIAQGRGVQFALSFLQGVWGEGINAGSDRGLNTIAARAGIDAPAVKSALADSSWRAVAQDNLDHLLALGLWGVPCCRVNDGPAYWGQDRLWLVERDLRDAIQSNALTVVRSKSESA